MTVNSHTVYLHDVNQFANYNSTNTYTMFLFYCVFNKYFNAVFKYFQMDFSCTW